ncbi:polyprenol monophosphomannose synthase [Lysinimonas soli]|uniref:Polyprenol monophosphomannose synthase n=1 Tax=Lysinimonas soli TaxID=1074233 RepID=A0ABW0NM77_9MICO
MSESIVVVLPTYNERENLEGMVRRLRSSVPEADLLVVDDGSPDGTGALADELATSDSRLHVLHRPAKQGLGAAYLAGFGWALEHGYEVVVESDVDGSHQPEELTRLLAALVDHDMVVGSRWVPGGSIVNWPRSRRIVSKGGSLYARVLLRLNERDVTGGYRAFRADALRAIGLGRIDSLGYCFQIEMLWRAERAGLRIAEVPITFVERVNGVSKMTGNIAGEAMLRVTVWGLREVLDRVRGRGVASVPASRRARVTAMRG